MNKKIFGLVFLTGFLFLPTINIYADVTAESQKQSLKISKQPIENAPEAVNEVDFTDNLFVGLAESDIVYQVDGGGFLCSTTVDHETLKQEFKENNSGVKLKAFTVSEAKEFYKKQLNKFYKKQLNKY